MVSVCTLSLQEQAVIIKAYIQYIYVGKPHDKRQKLAGDFDV